MSWNTNWLKAQIHTNKLLLLLKTTSKIVDNGPLHILLNIERNAGIAFIVISLTVNFGLLRRYF
jgi:hypothetical protein